MTESNFQDDLLLLKQREKKARAILGVSENASRQQIRRAFRKACRTTHPDAAGNNPENVRQFRLVCSAYRFLENNETSAELDAYEFSGVAAGEQRRERENPWSYWCWWRESFFNR